MNALLKLLLFAHVAGGAVSLFTFWIPAFAPKGGPLHRKAGRVYVKGGQWLAGTFLIYLAVITSTALYTGMRALKSKSGPRAYITPMYVALAWLTFASSAVVLVVGAIAKVWLLVGFSVIGLTAGPSALAFVRKPPTDSRYWWYEHFGGMIGTGIAAHVAFLNFGAQRVIPGFSLADWGMLAWFVPVVVGLVATNRLEAHYRRKFAGRARASSAPVSRAL